MKKIFNVTLTMIWNATIEVEAESAEQAIQHVQNNLDELAPDSIFSFGEITVDYAEPVN